jgi:hypothetical protein
MVSNSKLATKNQKNRFSQGASTGWMASLPVVSRFDVQSSKFRFRVMGVA